VSGDSAVRVVVLLPDVLGTYGDAGNAAVLAARLRWRGMRAEVVAVDQGVPVPAGGDVYVLGGGEDAAQVIAAAHLADSPGLRAALARGAPTLAVCAGMQVLGTSFTTADGRRTPGTGVLDLVTEPGHGRRHVGPVVAAPLVDGLDAPLVGFENHGGITRLGPGVRPLARVRRGSGNGAGDRSEGAVCGHVIGTYLHGPVLARNPQLADLLLTWVLGAPLPPLAVPEHVPAPTAVALRAM
jgi:CobQ-like glutamine amidotransferase family enzyme